MVGGGGRGEGGGVGGSRGSQSSHHIMTLWLGSPITQRRREVERVRKRSSESEDGKRNEPYLATEDARAHTRALTCLALDLLIVSEIGFFFSFTALLEKSSTNSPKSTAGSTTLSQTDEATALNSHTSQTSR